MNSDCRVGKHAACSGQGWNYATESITDCVCLCHTDHLREDLAA